jgi:hypothetical protein
VASLTEHRQCSIKPSGAPTAAHQAEQNIVSELSELPSAEDRVEWRTISGTLSRADDRQQSIRLSGALSAEQQAEQQAKLSRAEHRQWTEQRAVQSIVSEPSGQASGTLAVGQVEHHQ